MANYLKNFLFKLILLPVFMLLGLVILFVFLFAPQFRLIKDKKFKRQVTEF